jgi:hypothetical protein
LPENLVKIPVGFLGTLRKLSVENNLTRKTELKKSLLQSAISNLKSEIKRSVESQISNLKSEIKRSVKAVPLST